MGQKAYSATLAVCGVEPQPQGDQDICGFNLTSTPHIQMDFLFSKKDEIGLVLHEHIL